MNAADADAPKKAEGAAVHKDVTELTHESGKTPPPEHRA